MKNEEPKKKIKKGFDNEDIQKAVEVSPFLKGITKEIKDSNNEIINVLGNVAILLKSIQDEIFTNSKVPRERRSRLSKSDISDKFSKGIEDDLDDDMKVVGVKSNKSLITKALDEFAFGESGNNFDGEFAKALTSFEASGTLSPKAIERLAKDKKIKVNFNN
jgi:hypothetical protein